MLFESQSLHLQVSYRIAEFRFIAPPTWKDLIRDVNAALDLLAGRPHIDVVIIREFISLPVDDNACTVSREGQRLTGRIASLPVPTIAYIDGPCTGPALELALACQWRVAMGEMNTRFAADGIACWGGTARLPRLIGRTSALAVLACTAILTAPRAFELGLIDDIWSPRFAEVGLFSLAVELQRNPRNASSLARHWRRWQSGNLPAPAHVPTWLPLAINRGLRYGPEEAMVIERAAARAHLASRNPTLRHAA